MRYPRGRPSMPTLLGQSNASLDLAELGFSVRSLGLAACISEQR